MIFYKTNRFESIGITNRTESIRIANWNALVHCACSQQAFNSRLAQSSVKYVDYNVTSVLFRLWVFTFTVSVTVIFDQIGGKHWHVKSFNSKVTKMWQHVITTVWVRNVYTLRFLKIFLWRLRVFSGRFTRLLCVHVHVKYTRSSAIAEEPRDASCKYR